MPDVMVSAFGLAPGIDNRALLHDREMARMQRRSTTGQTFTATAEDTHAGREQRVAMHAAWGWLALWVVSTGTCAPG